MNEIAGDTKTKILDAAEKLFGLKSFDATSLRAITGEAGVNLAAINYHFQSKDALIDAVIARRVEPVNRRRIELLEAAGPSPTVEQILTAFFQPVLEQKLECLVPLMGRTLSDPSQFVGRGAFKQHLLPVGRRFSEALARALPDLPPDERMWRFHFTVGMMTHVLTWSKVLPEVSGGLCDVTDRPALLQHIVAFAAAGFRSPAIQHQLQNSVAERKG